VWLGLIWSAVRVVLRTPTETDREEFIAAMRASEDFHRPWIASSDLNESFERLLEGVADVRSDPNLLCRAEDGVIVGRFTLSQIVRGPLQSAFLGYTAIAAYSGQGFMTEGMQLLLRRAFAELELHRVEANIQPANERSLALVRRSGFVREGFSEAYLKIDGKWRDHERWAIRLEQWQATRGARSSGR
jgi:ribosomal-protein-alanine N-acetyltransferase